MRQRRSVTLSPRVRSLELVGGRLARKSSGSRRPRSRTFGRSGSARGGVVELLEGAVPFVHREGLPHLISVALKE